MVVPRIEAFASSMPNLDREAAITGGRNNRENFQLRVWKQELPKLPTELVSQQGWRDDFSSWKSYLDFCYQKDARYRQQRRERGDFDYGKELTQGEWTTRFLFNTLNLVVVDNIVADHGGYRPHPDRSLYGNHFHTSGDTEMGPLWWGDYWNFNKTIIKEIDTTSMLAHALSESDLSSAIETGVLAQRGFARACFSQDRVAFNKGWVVIYQAKDLIQAGYPLLQIDEHPRDASVLREWRSLAVDIKLARLITPSTSVPDYHKASTDTYYADSFFGEEFLANLPRL